MKIQTILIILCGCTLLGGSSYGETILYVDQNAPGPIHDGWTWCTAFTDLQDALQLANYDVVIRVADGNYAPDRGTGDREATFRPSSNVAVEGGYAGCGAPDPDQRDIELYETVLSGDLNGDDVGDLNDSSRDENSHHVVRLGGTVLEGFTITGGNADETGSSRDGAGIVLSGGTIANCWIRGNRATGNGGGVHNTSSGNLVNTVFSNNTANHGGGMSGDRITLSGCLFTGNSAASNGGAILILSGKSTLTNCTLIGNLAGGSGGGFYSGGGSETTLANCMIAGNTSESDGGGIYAGGRNNKLVCTNCLVTGNSSLTSGGGAFVDSEDVSTFRNCTFYGNSAPRGSGLHADSTATMIANAILWDAVSELSGSATVSYSNVYGGWRGDGNIFAIPLFVDALGADGIAGTIDDDLRLMPDSPCVDSGDPDFVPQPDETDLDGNPRVINDRIDMGAYEFQACEADLDCDDGNACTNDTCDVTGRCVYTPISCDAGYVCLGGECVVVCGTMDSDTDGDIDLSDLAVWQNCFTGPH